MMIYFWRGAFRFFPPCARLRILRRIINMRARSSRRS